MSHGAGCALGISIKCPAIYFVLSMSYANCTLSFTTDAETIRTSLSAVRHIDQYLWLGCDETATLERLTYESNQANDHQHFNIDDFLDLPSPDSEEVDVEGIAYADYYLWFVGSHSLKRKSYKPEKEIADNLKRLRKIEREDNRYTLGRIPLINGQLLKSCPHPDNPKVTLTAAQLKRKKNGNELTDYLREDRYLGDFLKADLPGKDNGLDIEGIAIVGERILLGLRGPVLRGWSVILEIQPAEDDLGMLKLKKMNEDKQRYLTHFLDLEGLGIRDLCRWEDKLLILAGPTMTLNGPVKVFEIPITDLQAGKAFLKPYPKRNIPYGQGYDRAEGLTLLGNNSSEILIVYDAPGKERRQGDNNVLADRFPLSPITSQPSDM